MKYQLTVRSLLVVGVIFSMSRTGPAALAQAAPASPNKTEDAIAALRKLLESNPELAKQLRVLLDQLDKDKGQKPGDAKPSDEPPIPDLIIPGDNKSAKPGTPSTGMPSGTTAGTVRASLTPDISVIGNNSGRFISVRGDKDRNRLQLGEIEVGLQQPIFPGIRFDAFLNGSTDSGFTAGFEEDRKSVV